MSKELKVSQKILMDHSAIKVKLLGNYMAAYLNILSHSKFIKDIYVADLFCGEGVYENGGEGSPIILLRNILKAIEASDSRSLIDSKFHCLFNDKSKTKIEALKSAVDHLKINDSKRLSIVYTEEDYRKVLQRVVSKFRGFNNERGFAFIDPYGYKEIRLEDIRNLLASGKTEVLLFLPSQFMYRFEKKATPNSLRTYLNDVMPADDIGQSINGVDFIEKLKNGLRNSLGSQYFVDSFIIARDKNQFFCLLFFTSHIYGFEKMLNAKWDIDNEEGRSWRLQKEPDLFSVLDKKPTFFRLEGELQQFLIEERSNIEIYEFTLRAGFLPRHAAEVLKKIESEGRLNVKSCNGNKPRKGAYYLSYDHFRTDIPKVKLKIK